MTDELTALVVAEKRGLDAVVGLTMIIGGALVFAALRVIPVIGYVLPLSMLGLVGHCLRKRHALGKLLARRNEIERVDRTVELGRPALCVHFLGGGSVTLKIWNHDPDRVFTLLSKRELPTARLLK